MAAPQDNIELESLNILTLQGNHRSSDIWDGQGLKDCVRTRRSDSIFWQFIQEHPLHPRILHYFEQSGFLGVLRAGRIHYDCALTTALLERWRPETNTFHFRCGEATITLQDVEVLFGLPVDGRAVVSACRDVGVDGWLGEIERLLGFQLTPTDFDGNSRLSVTTLKDQIEQLPAITPEVPEEVVQRHFRAYLMWLFGGTLFPDGSGSYIRLHLLPLLDDVEAIGSYSWGSAVLAYTYWALCRGSINRHARHSDFYGFTGLLQAWAWERLLSLQPKPRSPPENAYFTVHAQRWTSKTVDVDPDDPEKKKICRLDRDKTNYSLPVYRDILDGMPDDKFVWQPYDDQTIEQLPAWCSRGRYLWMAEVPMLCGEFVMHHLPGRVLRQFGCRQFIPPNFQYDTTLFSHDFRHKLNASYKRILDESVALWNDRAQKVVQAEPIDASMPDDGSYMRWYRKITRLLIGNPSQESARGYTAYAGKHEALARGLHCIHRIAEEIQGSESLTASHQLGQRVAAIASEVLIAARQGSRLSFDPDYAPDAAYDNPPPINLRRGVAARGRGRGRGRG